MSLTNCVIDIKALEAMAKEAAAYTGLPPWTIPEKRLDKNGCYK